MSKYFVFSDVHGEYDALMESLTKAGFDSTNENHILLSLGDNFDRGPDSIKVYNLLIQNRSICLKGNHCCFLEDALINGRNKKAVFNFLFNGLDATIQSFADTSISNWEEFDAAINIIKEKCPDLLQWIQQMPLYYETEHYIFCHAGINPYLSDWKKTDKDFMLWDIDYSHIACPNTDKIVIIGHHHAFRVRKKVIYEDELGIPYYGCEDYNKPIRIGNKIAIDPCSNYTHKVNVLVIED